MKKKSIILKIAMFALAIAPGIATRHSTAWIGEPELPNKIKK